VRNGRGNGTNTPEPESRSHLRSSVLLLTYSSVCLASRGDFFTPADESECISLNLRRGAGDKSCVPGIHRRVSLRMSLREPSCEAREPGNEPGVRDRYAERRIRRSTVMMKGSGGPMNVGR